MSDEVDRADAGRRIQAAAWDEGRTCEHCAGSGSLPGGRMLVHSRLGAIGADWEADAIIDALDEAEDVRWGHDLLGHDLAVLVERHGRKSWVYFEVPNPTKVDRAAGAR